MTNFTALIQILGPDPSYLNDVLDGTRYKLMQKGKTLFALLYGEIKLRNIELLKGEIEGELVSLGVHIVSIDIYTGVPPFVSYLSDF